MMTCAYKPCKNKFEPKTHNQKYCSNECCRVATNIKIKEKYYKNKARRSGVPFQCTTKGCESKLSPYSTEDICESCKNAQKSQDRRDILEMLRGLG
jgi:hypothetical protein